VVEKDKKVEFEIENIFSKMPKEIPEEFFETIVKSDEVMIERIISKGHATKEGKWYNQNKNEFVIVLKGDAIIEYKDGKKIEMNIGDYIIIPAHTKHRVLKTNEKVETIWLAVFY
jgi:cupin 2 domain-containing protein